MDHPLHIRQWIEAAEASGRLMKAAEFAEMPANSAVRIVPLELSMYVLEEYGARFPVPRPQTIYSPEQFFNMLTHTFTKIDTQSETQSEAQYETQCETQRDTQRDTQSETKSITQSETQRDAQRKTQRETQNSVCASESEIAGTLSGVLGVSPYVERICAIDGHAYTGSGDSFTRYARWSDISGMPPLYW